jgi:uncharacterized protein (TIGR00299 family) protein
MRIAYLEPFAGISGDMLLGAFVQAGVSVDLLRQTVDTLDLGASLDIKTVDRSGISSIKVDVLVGDQPAEKAHSHPHDHSHSHHHHDHGHDEHHHHEEHSHHHAHADARSLSDILSLIKHAALPDPVKALASRTFELLGASEAKIHNKPIESIHFHEVGAIDAIVDIVLAAAAALALNIDAWYCSPLNVGSGTVECAHGRFPVPAPATADLLRGAPTYSSGPAMELVTPTGAAIVRALGCKFESRPAMRTGSIGYGAGTRNPAGFANVLRLSLGETDDSASASTELVTVIETAIDDLSPQVIAHVMEQALVQGALDVMCTPVLMKKNRPGHLLTFLCNRKNAAQLEELIFRETSTLGLRIREERRSVLDRQNVTVNIFGEPVRIKVASRQGRELHAAPEFEDCRRIAAQKVLPLKHVQEAALQTYRQSTP